MQGGHSFTVHDAFGEYSPAEAKYFHLQHGVRFVALGIPEQEFYFLVRELFPGEPPDGRDLLSVTSDSEPALKGVVVATMPSLDAADVLIRNFLRNVKKAEGR